MPSEEQLHLAKLAVLEVFENKPLGAMGEMSEAEQMDFAATALATAALSAAEGVKSREDAWQSMDSAPTDGTPFVALEIRERSADIYARVYKYEGHPNYWHCKREGVCIRPSYQDSYVWAPLPADYEARIRSALQEGGE